MNASALKQLARKATQSAKADYVGLAAALGLLILGFGLATEHFLTLRNLRTIANQIPSAALLATGMTLVLVAAEIDLSVGSLIGFCGAVMGVLMAQRGWPLWAGATAAAAVGLACGLFNGLVTIRWKLPSFIVTLGMLEIARGAGHLITRSETQYIGARAAGIAQCEVLGLSLPFFLALGAVCLGQFVLTRTIFGRMLTAIGTNAEAVRLSGVNPAPYRAAVFALSGLLAGIGAVIDTSRFQSANPNAGLGMELQAIAAVVIGGTSLMGGRGSVVCSFIGVLIIAVLNSGLVAMNVRDETKRLVTGFVIIAAVILDHYRRRMSRVSE